MTRPTKFRGRRVSDGMWVYGYLVVKGKRAYIGVTKDTKLWFEVVSETVGQLVGLTDKNGKEIYEGDIISTWYDENEVVKWGNGGWLPFTNTTGWPERWKENQSKVEVLGNRFENHELRGPRVSNQLKTFSPIVPPDRFDEKFTIVLSGKQIARIQGMLNFAKSINPETAAMADSILVEIRKQFEEYKK